MIGGGRSRSWVGLIVACAVLLPAVADGAAVSRPGNASWVAQYPPLPAGATQGTLTGAACPLAGDCFAVGTSNAGEIVDRYAQGVWSVQPVPPQVNGFHLNGVSCSSGSACWAVGLPALHWNGTTWSERSLPATDALGVACPAASMCVTVGQQARQAMAERWNGATWKVDAPPHPGTAQSSTLAAVACSSPGACTAVGTYVTSGGTDEAFADRWNGTAWSLETVPTPSGALFVNASGVTCPASNDCRLVGTAGYTTPEVLTEQWNGRAWSLTQDNGRFGASELFGVACATSLFCLAAGDDWTPGFPPPEQPLLMRWASSTWTPDSNPTPAGDLNSVSCSAAGQCTSVGFVLKAGRRVPLAERLS